MASSVRGSRSVESLMGSFPMAVQPVNRRAPGDDLRPHTAARVVHPPDLGGGSWYTGRASSDLTDADAAKPDRGGALVDRLSRRATA